LLPGDLLQEMPYKSKGLRAQWEEITMKRAVNAVIVNMKFVKAAAREYGLPLETLRRKVIVARQCGGVEKKLGRPPILPEEALEELSQILRDMESRLYGLTPADVRRVVFKYVEKNGIAHYFNKNMQMAGRYWLEGFLARHRELSVRQAESVSIQRAIGFNKPKVDNFYSILKALLFDESGRQLIPPGNMFNVDESGFTVCQAPGKIISAKGKHSVGQITSAEKGKTAVCCASATGVFIPPMLIFPRVRLNPSMMNGAPSGAIGEASKSGWITEEIFTKWFEHFLKVVEPNSRSEKVLLLMDGHSSHTGNLHVIEKARRPTNNVELLIFPSHSTHRLQPLNLSFFKTLNTRYNSEIVSWLRSHPGRRVTGYEIAA